MTATLRFAIPRGLVDQLATIRNETYGATVEAIEVGVRLDTQAQIDARSDAHFERAVVGIEQLIWRYPVLGAEAGLILADVRDGLVLDAVEDEHLGAARDHNGRTLAHTRAATALAEDVADCRECGRRVCSHGPAA